MVLDAVVGGGVGVMVTLFVVGRDDALLDVLFGGVPLDLGSGGTVGAPGPDGFPDHGPEVAVIEDGKGGACMAGCWCGWLGGC